ncbi:TrmB family transcriptional regulator [Brevibacillus choshinensis]|uniref:TrmB family transcriptional regulator n=1 Tax=Brevibacillus choshinensis TaxID=54911 RepID=A0ABX7FR17_BRECH|nr:TrmB family transcriptional regulator [Brevibacillus choshinensis]QRG68698.1 TrmB family transcriptional regulator [Brevibacillus choshinensis]
MIEHLQQIGLSDLEARCYLALHEEANLSGYEVAKRVSVSRTNVYAALRSLQDKGVIRQREGDPATYDAVPVKELVRHLQSHFERTAETLVRGLSTPPRITPSFYSWRGTDQLDNALHRVIANADSMIVVDMFAEDVPLIEDALLHAEKQGVTVILICLGEYSTKLGHVFIHKRPNDLPFAEARKFSILCDYRDAVMGSFGGEVKPTALETDHPAVIETLKNAFYHDLLMQHVESDFGHLLAEKYGEHYEVLRDLYQNDKGWRLW